MGLIRKCLLTAQSRQKSYVDRRRQPLEFEVGDHVFFKLMPKRGVVRFGKRGKLLPRYIGSFEILKRVGTFAYWLTLPLSLSSVHEDTYGTFEEGPVSIMDSRDQVLRRKTVRLVKVLCNTKEWRRQHGNARTRCVPPILSYLKMKVRCSNELEIE